MPCRPAARTCPYYLKAKSERVGEERTKVLLLACCIREGARSAEGECLKRTGNNRGVSGPCSELYQGRLKAGLLRPAKMNGLGGAVDHLSIM